MPNSTPIGQLQSQHEYKTTKTNMQAKNKQTKGNNDYKGKWEWKIKTNIGMDTGQSVPKLSFT
jgi:hypothetical protein